MSELRKAAQEALEALESAKMNHGKMLLSDPPQEAWRFHRVDETLSAAITNLRAALTEPEQEPVATKQMLRWVERLKRLSDDGQHMSIPGLSSGACWELAIELEQFIRSTAPTPRKPLPASEIVTMYDENPRSDAEMIDFARAIEKAHGITGETK